jgi:hypothetical protein
VGKEASGKKEDEEDTLVLVNALIVCWNTFPTNAFCAVMLGSGMIMLSVELNTL